MKRVFQFFLKVITKGIIKKYDPFIIGITGSVGKTTTKEAIYTSLSGLKKIRKSSGNLNTEIGAPLVFLGEEKKGDNALEWILILLKGVLLLLKREKNYPEIIVAELAADKPGDMKYLADIIKPDIGIITSIGEVPVHVEFYKNAHEVAREKEELIRALKKGGTAILNTDDEHVSQMEVDSKKITFGFSKNADVSIKSISTESLKGSRIILSYEGKDFSMFLPSCVGETFAYIAACVFATGIALGINPERLPEMIEKVRPAKGRLSIIRGKNDSTILDGSYNAAPSSMLYAISALKELPGKRKIAVLGDMLELGNYSANEHRKIGKEAAQFCEYVFAVGKWAREIEKACLHAGMPEEKVFSFTDACEVIPEVEEIISPGDLILIKGSQGVRTEKVVFAIMRDPERAEELLVRQTSFWKNKQ